MRRAIGIFVAGLAFAWAAAEGARGQCGAWSEGFAAGHRITAFAVYDDGGGPDLYAAARSGPLMRWDGSEWSWEEGPGDQVQSLAVFDDGGGPALYAGTLFGLSRWDGRTWTAIPDLEATGDGVQALLVADLGGGPGLLVGGSLMLVDGSPAYLARWDGGSWSTPIPSPQGTVRDLALFDDGPGEALYAGGDFATAGGVTVRNIARWDGASWADLAGGVLANTVWDLQVHDDGTGPALYATGNMSEAGGVPVRGIARWHGASWSALGAGIEDGHPRVLASYDDGSGVRLFAAGQFDTAGGLPAQNIARWDGTSWSALGAGVDAPGWDLAVFDDGAGEALFVGGDFQNAGGIPSRYVARWDAGGWSRNAVEGEGIVEGGVTALTTWDDGTGPALYAGGSMRWAGLAELSHIARWDGSAWAPLGSGFNQYPETLCAFDDGSGSALYAGGSMFLAGGMPVDRIARWDGASWSPVGTGTDRTIFDLCVWNDALYAGGTFAAAGGNPAACVARWDGADWSSLGAGTDRAVFALCVWNGTLHAGGFFESAGGVPASRIACWDGTSWSPLGAGVDDYVFALAAFDDGSGPALYAGGEFTSAGGAPASRVARWDGASWSPVGAGFDRGVRALAVFDDGHGPDLYATGYFETSGGAEVGHVARWDGTSWSALAGGLDQAGGVLLAAEDAGLPVLWVGGSFSIAGGIGSKGIARWSDPCAPLESVAFCFGTDETCPCGMGGAPDTGCELFHGTGGVRLEPTAFAPNGSGGGTATFTGTGFPPPFGPTALLIRSPAFRDAPIAFGDGLACLAEPITRIGATFAVGGTATLDVKHAAGPGAFHYQLWFRNVPIGWCDDTAAFNLSNAWKLVWPGP